MGAPSDQFLHLLWRPPYVFFFVLYGGPSNHFFPYYIEAPRSLSSLTIWGPLSDQFHCLLYGSPLRSVSLHAIGGPPQILFFPQNIWGPSDQFLRLLYGGPLMLLSLLTIWGPLRSVTVHTFWGPLSDQFSLLLYRAPSDQFLRILYGGPLRSVYSFAYYLGALSDQLLCLLYGAPSDLSFAYYYYMCMGPSQISFFTI